MKTLIGKCTYTPKLERMKPESREKYENSSDYVFRTADNINPGDVIKINRMTRYGFFHCNEVSNIEYKFRNKNTLELFEELPEDANPKDYWNIPVITEGPANVMHYSHVTE